jgi:hypothetical protein
MPRGGKREGSGRRKGALGALAKRTTKIAEAAAAEGKTPLEIMLDNMRHFQQVALDAEKVIESMNEDQLHSLGGNHQEQFKALLAKVKQAAGLRVMAHECARDAAPFIHPKLSSVLVGGDPENPVSLYLISEKPMTEDEWEAQYTGPG